MPYDGSRSEDKNVLPTGWRGSTNLNSTIKSYEDLAYRVKAQLGFPITELEVSDEQVAIFIDEALEWFTLYSGRERKWLLFCDDVYEMGCGVKLDDIVRYTSLTAEYNTPSECFTSTTAVEVTGYDNTYAPVDGGTLPVTFSALLSASPFKYPIDITSDVTLTTNTNANTGQKITLKFDPSEPWDYANLCDADCITIRPKDSQWFELSASVSAVDFNDLIIEYPELSGLLDDASVSGDDDGIVPTSALSDAVLSALPLEYFSIDLFYDSASSIGSPVSGCIQIINGEGIVYPNCDADLINECSSLCAWGVDISEATHMSISGIPVCSTDGNIPLKTNTGIYATFTLCNSSINTEGGYPVNSIQFLKEIKLPSDIANIRLCDITNTGFNITHSITAYDDCVKHTPSWVPVDIELETKTTTDLTGCVVTELSSGYDNELNFRRKVIDVFDMDYTLGNGGYYGSNLLFSFDAGLVANAFGFDMQGNRFFYRNGYDLLTYHMARGFIDKVRNMLNYISYEFNPDTQYLRLIPEPYDYQIDNAAKRCYIVGVYVEKPLRDLINKKWVQEFVKARIMQTVGYIRSKFGNVTLFGGASLQGDSLVSMGNELEQRLLKELREDGYYTESPFFTVG